MNSSPFSESFQVNSNKLTPRDKRIARLLTWIPWLTQLLVTVPLPLFFLTLFLGSEGTDSAAIYLLLLFVSLGVGIVVGLVSLIFLLIYRRRWYANLRNRLAADGITASEVPWFEGELSTEERKTWRDMEGKNPLLADAYSETLATRLNATRIKSRAAGEVLRIERQISRVRGLENTDTSQLLTDLLADRQRLASIRDQATARLSTTKARLNEIEAAAHRTLNHQETEMMLRGLVASQEHLPLSIEMAHLEKESLSDLDS